MPDVPEVHSLPRARYLAHREEIETAIAEVFTSGQFILGAQTRAFEDEFARFLGAQHGVGVASGTDAIELALRACGIGPGDAALTVSWTATATVAAIERAGAMPVLADIDPRTFTLDPEAAQETIHEHQSAGGPKLKAIIPVHLYGHPADLPAILSIARRHGLRVIEDCAQAHGAMFDKRMAGSWGDLAAFSFYPTKNLGAFGDGGAVVTQDTVMAERVRALREYGWQSRYVSSVPGVNSRLDEVQSAILRVLLRRLPAENQQRRRLARRYDTALAGTGITPPFIREMVSHAFHQYVVRTPERARLRAFLEEADISASIHYPAPVHLQPAYAGRVRIGRRGLPQTEAAAREVLSLPMSPHLPAAEVERITARLGQWKHGPTA